MPNSPKVFTTGSSWLKFSTVEYPLLTGLTYNENSDKVESTTISTVAGYKSYLPLRSEATLTATLYADTGSADIPLRTEAVLSASFAGKQYTGLATCYNKSAEGTIDGIVGQTYEFTFNGLVTSILS
jgi:hypothetical protein